jgi:tetratricopeptide (TPR) repeat protein
MKSFSSLVNSCVKSPLQLGCLVAVMASVWAYNNPDLFKNNPKLLNMGYGITGTLSILALSSTVLKLTDKKSLANYNKEIELDPQSASAYLNRGLLKHHSFNDLPGASADYDKVIELDPQSTIAYLNRGLLKHHNLNDLPGALADYDKVIELDPQATIIYLNRGLLKQNNLNDLPGAIQDLQQAATLYHQKGEISCYRDIIDLLQKLDVNQEQIEQEIADSNKNNFSSKIWLLRGIGNAPGTLKLVDGQFSFTVTETGSLWPNQLRKLERIAQKPGLASRVERGEPAQVFCLKLEEIKVDFPWYSFNGVANITIDKTTYRFSFVRPENRSFDSELFNSIALGKTWRNVLTSSIDKS